MIRDRTLEDAVLDIFDRHGLKASVLEPALRNDRHFGNVMGKWRAGSLVISIVSDRGQWFADLYQDDNPETKVDVYDVVASPTELPLESLEQLVELIAGNFAAIDEIVRAQVQCRASHT